MPHDDDVRAALLRKFEAAVSGPELAGLRGVIGAMSMIEKTYGSGRARPELRRPALPDLMLYRVRVDLNEAKPPIWRRLDLRSDTTLDALHRILQAAFGWTDSHLHRFMLGGGLFDMKSQLFLCPYEAEADDEDHGGIAGSDVRLDETVQDPGDVLRYVYDYGELWELTLRLEKVLPALATAPTATCVGGRRAAPPEDCGGARTAEDLAYILADPALFGIDEVNRALRSSA